MKLKDKVAIVTGGGRGMGREIALALSQEGAQVVLFARTANEINSVAVEIRGQGGKAVTITGDVRSEADIKGLFQQTLAKYSRLDILVNNAGTAWGKMGLAHVKDMPLEDFLLVLNTNVVGTFLCCRAAVGIMVPQKSGVIINLIGQGAGGSPGYPGYAAYNASKSAIEIFTMTLAKEVAEYNIRANNLQPGGAYAGTQADRVPGQKSRFPFLQPRIIRPLVVFLAGDESKGITGKNFRVPEWNKEHGYPNE